MQYEVYKKIRRKATVFGMPATNFIIMIVVDTLFFLLALAGFSLLRVLIILIGWIASFVLARFVFNDSTSRPSHIDDYNRR